MQDERVLKEKGILMAAFIVAFLILVGIIYVVVHAIVTMTKSAVDIYFTPLSATVTIDGNEVAQNENRVSPGQHEVRVEKFGFETETFVVDVQVGETVPVYVVLQPNIDFTMDWYLIHPEDSKMAEGITGYELEYRAKKHKEEYPNLSKLPVKQTNYSIYQQECEAYKVCIRIIADINYRDDAINYFKDKIDSDVGKYYFIITDYYNPFRGEG